MELTPAQKFDATIRAAAAGDICVVCFRLMPPGASVTMVRRQLRQPGRPSPFGRVPDGRTSVAVPVCLDCTLSDDIEQRTQWLRRCKGCGRVMRHFPSAYDGPRFPRVCSWACAYMVKLARSKVVRRVERFTEICDGCGELIRAQAVGCAHVRQPVPAASLPRAAAREPVSAILTSCASASWRTFAGRQTSTGAKGHGIAMASLHEQPIGHSS